MAASQLQPPLVRIVALQAATFDNYHKNWWLPAHNPIDQGGSGICRTVTGHQR